MVHHLLHLTAGAAELAPVFARVRDRLGVPGPFPRPALDEAGAVAAAPPVHDRDRTDLPLVTIDPPGSMDLDQALHLARRGPGFRVHYAIADVGSFVASGGALDRAARARGVTHYGPDERALLHPARLSEDAASLLPGATRPALVWQVDLDGHAQVVDVRVRRAMVRSRARFTPAEVAEAIGAGVAGEMLSLLPLFGEARREIEVDRGGINLPMPDQEIVRAGDGYRLQLRRPLDIEDDNAQLSLLTGIAAAGLMRAGRIGVQRTLPAADAHTLARLRAAALALGIPWGPDDGFPAVVRGLDPDDPRHAAFLDESTVAFRGSGYTAYQGSVPDGIQHAGIAADYAHVTAPLRRLVDRWGLEICLALSTDRPVPDWVRESMDDLPELMEVATTRAHRYERACVDVVEAALLHHQIGRVFDGTVIDLSPTATHATVMLADPPVRAPLEASGLELGHRLRVRVVATDVPSGTIELERAE